jgi:hypothetical protein
MVDAMVHLPDKFLNDDKTSLIEQAIVKTVSCQADDKLCITLLSFADRWPVWVDTPGTDHLNCDRPQRLAVDDS